MARMGIRRGTAERLRTCDLGPSRKKIPSRQNASALERLWLFLSNWTFYFLERPYIDKFSLSAMMFLIITVYIYLSFI